MIFSFFAVFFQESLKSYSLMQDKVQEPLLVSIPLCESHFGTWHIHHIYRLSLLMKWTVYAGRDHLEKKNTLEGLKRSY